MATTPPASENIRDTFDKDAIKEASSNLKELQRRVGIAAEETKDMSFANALEWAEEYLSKAGHTIPRGLKQMLMEARGNDDVKEPYHGQELDLAADDGAWGNLIVDKGFNLLVAAPKVGKSALIAHLFACAKRSGGTCLGKTIRKPWNKLIISGSDMSASQWGKVLIREGLATPSENAQKFLPCDDVIIWDQGNPARMNEKGIKAMRDKCLEFPDSLLVIDSLRSNIDPSIDENKAEVRGPIDKTKEGLNDCEVTVALIHHANKSVSGSTAVNAAAGSNAISGACDGTLLMKYLVPDGAVETLRGDWRVLCLSSGRIQNDKVMIELTQEGLGQWICHEEMDLAMKEQAVYEMEERLTTRQALVYDHAEELAENGIHTTAMEIATQLNLTSIKARKSLEQLVRKGMMAKCGTYETGASGRQATLYAPALSDLANPSRAKREKNGVSKVLLVSNPDHMAIETLETIKTPSVCPSRVRARESFPNGTVVEREDAEGQWVVTCSIDPDRIRLEKVGHKDLISRISYTKLRHATAIDSIGLPSTESPTSSNSEAGGAGVFREHSPLSTERGMVEALSEPHSKPPFDF